MLRPGVVAPVVVVAVVVEWTGAGRRGGGALERMYSGVESGVRGVSGKWSDEK